MFKKSGPLLSHAAVAAVAAAAAAGGNAFVEAGVSVTTPASASGAPEPERAMSAIARTQPEAVLDHNMFRASRMYSQPVSEAMDQWRPLLLAIFQYYQGKERGGKRMHMEHFCLFCEESGLSSLKTGLSRREARIAFVFAQMETVDDVAKHYNVVTASFLDFCEALCRLVDGMCPPSTSELREFFAEGSGRGHPGVNDQAYALNHPHVYYYFHVPDSEVGRGWAHLYYGFQLGVDMSPGNITGNKTTEAKSVLSPFAKAETASFGAWRAERVE